MKKDKKGFTLVEVMIATSLAAMLMLATITSFLFILRGDRSLANYSEMNEKARVLLEQMGRDFRTAGDITVFTANSAVVSVPITQAATTWENVTWTYDSAAQTVTRTNAAGVSIIYANNVSTFTLTYYNTSGVASANGVEIKQVQLSMRIFKSVSQATTSQYVISAQFTMRSKSTTV